MGQNMNWMEEYRRLLNEEGTVEEFELIKGCYEGNKNISMNEQMSFMEEWLKDSDGRPLLVLGAQCSGKKTLLCQFLSRLQRKSRYLQLIEFGSITPLYSQIIYRMMVTLRFHFNICQKVELNEQKLRRYFKYWLQITSSLIEKQYIGYPVQEKQQVVIVIEGIDLLSDAKQVPVSPQFWLPQRIPANIKLILSSTQPQPNLMHRVTTLQFTLSNHRMQQIVSSFSTKLLPLTHKLSLFELKTLEQVLKMAPAFTFNATTFKDILRQYVLHTQTPTLTMEMIKSLLLLLTITKKGLTSKVLQQILELKAKDLNYFLERFAAIVREEKGYYIICGKQLKKTIIEMVGGTREKQKAYHEVISHMVKREGLSGRNLQEQIHHLSCSENYNELKEQICKIQNFMLLYTPGLKNLLCRSWARLEHLQQYDPVFEYNKAVEAFAGYYYPKEEDLFRIIFQICMFFKEYSEFENPRTPAFRHPPVRGDSLLLNSINIYQELNLMNMLCSPARKPLPHNKSTRSAKQDKEGEQLVSSKADETVQCNNETQSLNLTIVSKQTTFREKYLGSMERYLKEYFKPMQQSVTGEKEGLLEAEESDMEDEENLMDTEGVRDSLLLKEYDAYLEEDYHKSGEEQKYYYYKQWLWLQFPWLCQSIRHNYSRSIHECITSPTQFMSVEKEFSLIRKVLKLTQLAKDSKANIYQRKEIQLLSIKKVYHNRVTIVNEQLQSTRCKPNTHRTIKDTIKDTKQNVVNYKLDLSTIDKEIERQEEYAVEFKKKHMSQLRLKRSEVPNQRNIQSSVVFVTDGYHLPKLSQCQTSKVSLVSKQLGALLSKKQSSKLVRRHDELKHENKQLISKIEELRKTMIVLEGKSISEELSKVQMQVQESEGKKIAVDKMLCSQQQLKHKLETIIKITEINQMHGSESQSLGGFLSSLKFMIDIEVTNTRKVQEEIKKFLQETKNEIKVLKNKKKDAQKELRIKQKETVNVSEELEKIAQDKVRQHFTAHNQNQNYKVVKEKCIQKKKYSLPSEYQILETVLLFKYEEKRENQIKVEMFLAKLEKNKELKLKNKQLEIQLREKQKNISCLREDAISIKCKQKHEKDIQVRNKLITRKQYLQKMKQRNILLQKYIPQLQNHS